MSVIHWTPVETIGKDRIRNCVIAKCGAGVWNDRSRQTTNPEEVTCKSCKKTHAYRWKVNGEPSKTKTIMTWFGPRTITNPKYTEWLNNNS